MKNYQMNLNNYGGLIWTNHALQRLSERELNKVMLGLFGIDQIKVGTPKLKELGFITNLACLDWQGGGVYKNRSSSKTEY